jgi:hypothetical protein
MFLLFESFEEHACIDHSLLSILGTLAECLFLFVPVCNVLLYVSAFFICSCQIMRPFAQLNLKKKTDVRKKTSTFNSQQQHSQI